MRITGGTLGGRRFKAPRGETVRPTQDRVREAVFSSLAPRLAGAAILDCFAGSGALGMEAWSRGAARVMWVERDPATFRVCKDNVTTLCGAEIGSYCVRSDVFRFLRRTNETFDFILADPPYSGHTRTVEVAPFLDLIKGAGCVSVDGGVIFEQRSSEPSCECQGWQVLRDKVYGTTRVTWYAPADGSD